jgi:hypothetical protein
LIFMLPNGQRPDLYFLGAQGHLLMGVALLVAAPTVVRIVKLRLMASRHRGRIAATQSPTGERVPGPSEESKRAGS